MWSRSVKAVKAMAVVILLQAAILALFFLVKNSGHVNQSTISDISDSINQTAVAAGSADALVSLIDTISQKNEATVRSVRQFCNQHQEQVVKDYPYEKYNSHTLDKWIWIYSKHHKLFYCATPKCGSTTWKTYLLEDLGSEIDGDTHEVATGLGVHDRLKALDMSAIKYLQTQREDNRMLVVRNPWARIVSAFKDKVKVQGWPLKRLCVGWQKYKNVKIITFEMFVDCLLQRPANQHKESHTHPITALCAVCLMDYNIILKLEDLAESKPFVMERLKFNRRPEYIPPQKAVYENTYKDYYRNLTKSAIDKLADVYRYDIKIFGYPGSPFD